MQANIELAGVVADDYGAGQEAMRLDAAPQCPLGGHHHGIRIDLECRDAEPFEMGVPDLLVGEVAVRMIDQASDHVRGQRAFAHVSERLGIEDVIVVAGAQQLEEIEPALEGGGTKPGEMRVADLRTEAIGGFVPRASVVTVIQAALESPARSTSRASVRKPS